MITDADADSSAKKRPRPNFCQEENRRKNAVSFPKLSGGLMSTSVRKRICLTPEKTILLSAVPTEYLPISLLYLLMIWKWASHAL